MTLKTIFTSFALTSAAVIALSSTAMAAGDVAAGEKDYKKCRACHAIVSDDGTVIQKGGKTGPNLYGVIGRVVGSYPDFTYSPSLSEIGQEGTTWNEDNLAAFITNPKDWVQQELDSSTAKSKMTFKLRKGQADMAAYLASIK